MDPHFVRPEDRSRIAGRPRVAIGFDGLPDCYRSEGFAEDLADPVDLLCEPARPPAAPVGTGRRATDFLSPRALAALPPRRPWGVLGLARG
jgi:hypothetical protein